MYDVKRNMNENEYQYLWRIGQAKDNGLLDMDWNKIAALMNIEFGDSERKYSEAAYRKPYTVAKKFLDSGVFELNNGNKPSDIQKEKQELQKETIKIRDERNELRRLIREEARKESYKDQVIRAIKEHSTLPLEYDKSKQFNGVIKSDNDLIISCTDIHAGIEIDNYFNKFNSDILKERLNTYLDKILKVQWTHGSENAFVILSELISGLIHNELRIESNQNIIEQFLTVSDYISQFLTELSYHFEKVHVYIAPGNHSRISPKKEDSLKGENIDHLVIPFLEAKLQNFENVKFHYNDIEESIAMFSVRGNVVMACHGDKDEPSSVVQKLTMMFNMKPKIVYMGHRHTNAMSTVYNTKILQSGCFSGADNYCMDKRLFNFPEQIISVVNKDGLDCFYDVTFIK